MQKGENITEKVWKDYVKLTQEYEIPIENMYDSGKLVSVNLPEIRANHKDPYFPFRNVKFLQKI